MKLTSASLAAVRTINRISQMALAANVGVHHSLIARLESGDRRITDAVNDRLCKVLHVHDPYTERIVRAVQEWEGIR